MKTTVDIPAEVLKEAMKYSKAATKREAVLAAMQDYNRRQRAKKVVAMFGTFKNMMSAKELRHMREARDRRHDRQWHGAR
jgi:hypothetical protein